jgi:hypothetical protein
VHALLYAVSPHLSTSFSFAPDAVEPASKGLVAWFRDEVCSETGACRGSERKGVQGNLARRLAPRYLHAENRVSLPLRPPETLFRQETTAYTDIQRQTWWLG